VSRRYTAVGLRRRCGQGVGGVWRFGVDGEIKDNGGEGVCRLRYGLECIFAGSQGILWDDLEPSIGELFDDGIDLGVVALRVSGQLREIDLGKDAAILRSLLIVARTMAQFAAGESEESPAGSSMTWT
jgi:hypothetical protein